MNNLVMERKIKNGKAIDVSKCERDGDGNYILESFTEDIDYCDASTETRIWSIGEHVETGRILAATNVKFYQNPAYKCLWLR